MSSAVLTKEEEELQFRKRVEDKKRELENSKFWQQNIPTWRPVYDNQCNFWIFFGLSVFFVSTGLFIQYETHQIALTQVEVNYSDTSQWPDCKVRDPDSKIRDAENNCTVTFEVKQDMKAPVYAYYKIGNMYQNHRRYVKSRSYDQLAGKYLTADQVKTDCDPVVQVKDLWTGQQKSISGKDLSGEMVAVPCGLMAKSFFNDSISLYKGVYDDKEQWKKNEEFELDKTNIAWTTDVSKFSNIKNLPAGYSSYKDIQWLDMQDPRFIVWMRNAGLPTFRKLYGIIDKDVPAGKYSLRINNQYDVQPFEGSKTFVLSNANVLGGKNVMLYHVYFIAGTITSIMALFFMYNWCKAKYVPQ